MTDHQATVEDQGTPSTGDHDLDVALEELGTIENAPLEQHIEVGEAVHRLLQGRLGDLRGA
jgi:hypothetical protein